MPRIRRYLCYVDFSKAVFACSGSGALTQAQVRSVWQTLPMTGAAWIERGRLFVQNKDPDFGGKVFNLGPVASGVTTIKERRRKR